MATAQRLDVKESKDLAALEEFERGDFTYSEVASQHVSSHNLSFHTVTVYSFV